VTIWPPRIARSDLGHSESRGRPDRSGDRLWVEAAFNPGIYR
jgi:hypothetical protein